MKFQRLKYRRRDVSSNRYFREVSGVRQEASSKSVNTTALPKAKSIQESPRVQPQLLKRAAETRNLIRMEGDSIAYFWALEAESAIAYDTLVLHWRDFTRALLNESTASRLLLCASVTE